MACRHHFAHLRGFISNSNFLLSYNLTPDPQTMTFVKSVVECCICTFVGIALARTLLPDERLNRLLGRTPDVDQSQEGAWKQTKNGPPLVAQWKSLARLE